MRHFLCMALKEIQYGRKREALLAQSRGGPCDGQTRQESLARLSTTLALLCSKAGILQRAWREHWDLPPGVKLSTDQLID